MKLSKLKINPNNPQTFDDLSKLENSIKEFPKMMDLRPLVYDPANMQMLGGNKRLICLQNLGYKEIPDNWIVSADELTEDEKKRFILADNIGFGEWDWEILETEFKDYNIEEWGIINEFVNDEGFGENFSLPNGDKEPFQQQTYTLADKQAEQIKNAIIDIKKTEEYKYVETFGNENSNGNALYLIIMQWVEQKK
jgi:hypothetical protein